MGIFDRFKKNKPAESSVSAGQWNELARSRPGVDVMTRFEHPSRGLLVTGKVLNGSIYTGDRLSSQRGQACIVREIELLRTDIPELQRIVSRADPGDDAAVVVEGCALADLDRVRELLRLEQGDSGGGF